MDPRQLLDRYEATGDENTFTEADAAYAAAGDEGRDARMLLDHGYLLECHARYALRRAVARYERALQLDPHLDKANYQLIHAKAALGDGDEAITRHRQALAATPDDVRQHRFLAYAYLASHDHRRAADILERALLLAPDDPLLTEFRGDARAGLDDTDGALTDWRRALDLDPDNLSPLYSTAFLLERLQRIDEAAITWREIHAWNEARGNTDDTKWATQELHRLQG